MLYSSVKLLSFSTEFSYVKEEPSPIYYYRSSSLPLPTNLLLSFDFDLLLLILCLDLLSFTSENILKIRVRCLRWKLLRQHQLFLELSSCNLTSFSHLFFLAQAVRIVALDFPNFTLFHSKIGYSFSFASIS